jgi:CDP-4-dehydro-6-deoxyglucose reductase, E1
LNELRKQILTLVQELYETEHAQKKFIPGTTYIPYAGRVFDHTEICTLVESSLDFWLTAGPYAQKLESELSDFIGRKYCLLCNSGSSANLLAVAALTSPKLGERQLRPHDKVITTACGFPTTLNPIVQNLLVPVFVDVELGTYNPSLASIKKAYTTDVKAIFIAHTLGNVSELEGIRDFAREKNIWFIEDNCDALGSQYKKKLSGTYGDIATLSFYPPHHMTMGEGGAVLADDSLLKNIIASFRDWGRDCWCASGQDNACQNRFGKQYGDLPFGYDHKYVYSHIGYNLKLTDLQAAIGLAQIKKMPRFIDARKRNFCMLFEALAPYQDVLLLPIVEDDADPSWFGFPILVKPNAPFSRHDIVVYLENKRIATRMLFGGNLTKQPAYLEIKHEISGTLENTDSVMNNLFWVGVYPGLTEEMITYMISTFNSFLSMCNKKTGDCNG